MQLPDGSWTWKYDKKLRDPSHPNPAPDFETMWHTLRHAPCPVLIVRAGERSHINEDLLPDIEALAPAVQLATVPRAGHSVMGDNPIDFERVVSSFLKSLGLKTAGVRGS